MSDLWTWLRNWSERNDPGSPNGSWVDCMHCSGLDCLIAGGADIPDPYTVSGRERFEDADGLPEYQAPAEPGHEQETGLLSYGPVDTASLALYRVALHPANEAELPMLLNTAGGAIALPGSGAGLPSGFGGAHAVCILPVGDGMAYLLDPLRPMGAAPEGPLSVGTLLAWHRRNPIDIRYAQAGEFLPAPLVLPEIEGEPMHIKPARILDTRPTNPSRQIVNVGLAGEFQVRVAREFQVAGVAGIPADAISVFGNLTVTEQTAGGYLAAGPQPMNQPDHSNLNFPVKDDRANWIDCLLGPGGKLAITYASAPTAHTHVIFDAFGYGPAPQPVIPAPPTP